MGEKKKTVVKIETDTHEIDEAIKKAERFRDLMQEATELLNSIASTELSVGIDAVFNDKATVLASITTE